ncbi:hypothetical protein HK104_001645 [Borealophlyctis nickersoniae]|nr:hypothetical protein HK104_001645 [Borealophlyctis nickersoniae]
MMETRETEDELGKGKAHNPTGNVTKLGDETAQASLGKPPPPDPKDGNDPIYKISDPEQEAEENAFCDPGFMKMYYADRQHEHNLEERLFQVQSQLVEILNNRGSSSDLACVNKEKRDRQGRNLQKFHGDKDANAMAVSGFHRAHHNILDLSDHLAEREAEPSIQTREAFVAAFRTHFTPVNTQNTTKGRWHTLRFVLSLRDYTTNFTKLLSEERAAKSAEFSQDDLKTWFLSGLRPSSNEHGKWIADLTIPAGMALHGTSVPGTKFSRRCAPTELSSTPTESGEGKKRVIASVNATISRHLTPRFFNGKPEPLIAKHTFVAHGKLNGRFVRILIDTGCNTLMVRTGWIAQHKLLQELYHPPTEIEVNWGDDNGTYCSTSLFEGDLDLWIKEGHNLCLSFAHHLEWM